MNPISFLYKKESQLNGKLNPTTLRFRFCYVNIQVLAIDKSNNLDMGQSIVLARCAPLCHASSECTWVYTS